MYMYITADVYTIDRQHGPKFGLAPAREMLPQQHGRLAGNLHRLSVDG